MRRSLFQSLEWERSYDVNARVRFSLSGRQSGLDAVSKLSCQPELTETLK